MKSTIPQEAAPVQLADELPGFVDDKQPPASADAAAPADPFAEMSDEDKVTAITDIDARITKIRATRTRLVDSLVASMIASSASVLVHPSFDVKLEPTKTVDIRISELRKLYDLVEAGAIEAVAVNKLIWLERPDPFWKTDLRYVKGVAKFGSKAQAILSAGIVTIPGDPHLSIKPKKTEAKPPVNVTPGGVYDGGGAA